MTGSLKSIVSTLGIKPQAKRAFTFTKVNTQRLLRFLHYRRSMMFLDVIIEVSSYCNRRCPACPVSLDPRAGKTYMSDSDYEHILEQLADIDYNGRIALHLYNEPLEDKNIVSRVRAAHRMVPKAFIVINTNGDYLSNPLLTELEEAGLDQLYVTAYTDSAFTRLGRIAEEATARENRMMEIRRAPDFIGNRGGSLETVDEAPTLAAGCHLPSSQLIINYKSQVLLCCNDYYETVELGDVREQSLLDIWYGPEFSEIRDVLNRKDRKSIDVCAKCNLHSTPYEQAYLTAEEIVEFNQSARQ